MSVRRWGVGCVVGCAIVMGVGLSPHPLHAEATCPADSCNKAGLSVTSCKKGEPAGFVFNGETTADECVDGKTLKEWFCSGTTPKFVLHDCWKEFGKPCTAGMCGVPAYYQDKDNDGIPDKTDICPSVPNVSFDDKNKLFQKDSDLATSPYVDSDTGAKEPDGFGDECDNCPYVWNKDQKDSDGDGVGDACDNCKFTKNKDQKDTGNTGIGDACKCDSPDDEGDPMSPGVADSCVNAQTVHERSCNQGTWMVDLNIPCPPNFACQSDPAGKGSSCVAQPGSGSGGTDPGDPIKPPGKDPDPNPSYCKDPVIKPYIIPELVTPNFNAVAVAGGMGWIAGEGGNIAIRTSTGDYQWITSPWVNPQKPLSASGNSRDITALWSPDATSVFATTEAGYLFRWEDNTWTQWGPTGMNDGKIFGGAIYAVHGISADDFWIAGRNGLLWHFTKSVGWVSAKDEPSPTVLGLYAAPKKISSLAALNVDDAIWRGLHVAAETVWVVGDGGRIISGKKNRSGSSWTDHSLAKPTRMHTVWADDKSVIVGGANSELWCGSETSLAPCAPSGLPPDTTILRVTVAKDGSLYIVGNHSTFMRRVGAAWTTIALPFPNTLTDVSLTNDGVVASGVNGVRYELKSTDSKPVVSTMLRGSGYHADWTQTKWTSMQGSLGSNPGMDDLWVAGDDLAIAHFDGISWALLYSDDSVVPFVSTQSHSIHDLLKTDDGTLYAVGEMEYVLKGQSANALWTWTTATLPTESPPPPKLQSLAPVRAFARWLPLTLRVAAPVPTFAPEMKTVRAGPNGTVVVAGNLGIFNINFKFQPAMVQHLWGKAWNTAWQAVALYGNDSKTYDMATQDGMYSATADGGSGANWIGGLLYDASLPPLTVEDIQRGSDGAIAIVANSTSATANGYYLISKNGKWQALQSPKQKFLGLHPFHENMSYSELGFPIIDKDLSGMVVFGANGYFVVNTDAKVIPIQSEYDIDWYRGTYGNFSWNHSISFKKKLGVPYGVESADYSFDVDVLGVGSQNAVRRKHVYQWCHLQM